MDNQLKTSFIPRKNLEEAVNLQTGASSPRRVGGVSFFSILAFVIFIVAIGTYIFTFVWQIKLQKDIVKQVETMKQVRDTFDEKFVQDALRLNTRIEQSGSILQNHVSPSSLYALLQDYTLQTVSFSNFTFKDNQDGTLGISGSGVAARYESIVLQSDAFGKSGYLRNVIFTDLKPDQSNSAINFSLQATLDPKLILYRKSLQSTSAQTDNIQTN
jgi:hypothetical protein